MKSRQARLALIGLALGVLLALSLAPQTRWLVRLQMLTALRLYHPFPSSDAQSYTLSQADDDRHIRAVSARRPGDFDLHFAAAVNRGDSAQDVVNLRALETRFPNQPALYAGILRYASSGLHWNRTEENLLYGLPLPPQGFHPVPNAPEALTAYDRDAAAGERLDPNNAYFSIMRAVGLFAAGRDAEALAAVNRSSRKTEWQEYMPKEVEARWRLHETAFGDPGAFPRSVTAYSMLLPQYAKQRALARLLLAKAVQQERAGHAEDGLNLREELRHYGDLMRVQSNSLIGPLVGIAISSIATGNPGGTMPPKYEPGLKPEQMAQRRLDAYCAYVTRIGHPEAAAQARAEEEARRKVTALASVDRLPDLTSPIFRLAAWWLASLAALGNCGWLLLCGAVAVGLARGRQFREAAPLPTGTTGGIIAALLLGLLGVLLGIFNPMARLAENLAYYLGMFILLPGALVLSVAVLRPHLRRPLGIAALACLASLVVFGALGALLAWQAQDLNDLLTAVKTLTNSSDDNDDTRQVAQRLQWVISSALAAAVPILLLIVSSTVARIRRIPVSVGFIQGFRAAALPLACLLLVVWGGLLLGTVRQEHMVSAQVWHQVHDEGPYLAAQAGQSWPGPVP